MLQELFDDFKKEKTYINGVAKKTLTWYWCSFEAYKRVLNGTSDALPTKPVLTQFIIGLRQTKLSITSCNNYIRGINSFLTWLYENEHTKEHLKMKLLKDDVKTIKTFSESQVKAMLDWKPKKVSERRLYVLLCFLLDTGARIDEAITLTRDRVDLDNLLITLRGKGSKERIIPISLEYRKTLFKHLRSHQFELVFCTNHGTKLRYRNLARDFKNLGDKLGISGVRMSYHTIRHTFAYNYIRSGGNVLYLQRILGHTDLKMTRRYVDLQPEDLGGVHSKHSLLSRLR